MRRTTITIAGFAALSLLVMAGPALAANGALARDDETGKFGLSSNEEAQTKADDVAMKICGTDKCKIIFRTAPRECGAIATAGDNKIWGGAKRPQKAAAELAAMENCQKRFKGQCKIRGAECNR